MEVDRLLSLHFPVFGEPSDSQENAVEVRDLLLGIKNIYKPKPPTVVA